MKFMCGLEKKNVFFSSIPAGTSPEMKDLLHKLLKRNAKDRISFGKSPNIINPYKLGVTS